MKLLLSFICLFSIAHIYCVTPPCGLAAIKNESGPVGYTILYTLNSNKAKNLSDRIATQDSALTAAENKTNAFLSFFLSTASAPDNNQYTEMRKFF